MRVSSSLIPGVPLPLEGKCIGCCMGHSVPGFNLPFSFTSSSCWQGKAQEPLPSMWTEEERARMVPQLQERGGPQGEDERCQRGLVRVHDPASPLF